MKALRCFGALHMCQISAILSPVPLKLFPFV
ncbi:hypothetical protein SCA6_008536 [Theobroma cacao]